MFHPVGSKATVCAFPYMPDLILTGHESGKVALFDASTGDEVLSNERAHMDVVTDLQLSADGSYFITSSKDKTARIHDAKTLTVLKTFPTETPLNSAALAPNMPYVRFPFPRRYENMFILTCEGSSGRWSRGDERHDDVVATGQVRSAFLASHLRRGGRPRQGSLWPVEHVRLRDIIYPVFAVDIIKLVSQFTRQGRPTPLGEKTVSYVCTILMRATLRHARMVKQKFSTRSYCMMSTVSLRV